MSDTLPASAHRVNSSGNCSISGCPCRGWSAQETAGAIAFVDGTLRDVKDTNQLATTSEHQPAARGGGDEPERIWINSGAWWSKTPYPTGSIEYIRADQHQALVAEREQMVEALKGVAIMLNTELEKYDKEPWAQRVRAAIVN